MTYQNGDRYSGSWYNDKRHGFGKFELIRGDVFEGEWKIDIMHGAGVLKNYDGSMHEGVWENGDCITKKASRLREEYQNPAKQIM